MGPDDCYWYFQRQVRLFRHEKETWGRDFMLGVAEISLGQRLQASRLISAVGRLGRVGFFLTCGDRFWCLSGRRGISHERPLRIATFDTA